MNKTLITEKKVKLNIINIIKKERTEKVYFLLIWGKCVFLIPPVPSKSIA